MTKLKFSLVLSLCFFASNVVANELHDALDNHAKNASRTTLNVLIEQRARSITWSDILRNHLPKEIDDRCGYQELARLRETGFEQMKQATQRVLGKRLEAELGTLLSRPGSSLHLVTVKSRVSNGVGESIVAMRVSPSRSGDRLFTLNMKVDGSGYMRLCDISQGIQFDKGFLREIGDELWAPKK